MQPAAAVSARGADDVALLVFGLETCVQGPEGRALSALKLREKVGQMGVPTGGEWAHWRTNGRAFQNP